MTLFPSPGRVAVLLLLLALPAWARAPSEELSAPPPISAEEQLQDRLWSLIRACRRCRWGVLVKDPGEGSAIFAHNESIPFNPASNVKLITGIAALRQLGAEFRFSTSLFGQLAGGDVAGGLYLQGGGDPTMSTTDLARLADALYQLGVRSVSGPLYLDGWHLVDAADPPGFRSFASSHPFRAGVGAISLNFNIIRVTVTPAESPGMLALVTVRPESPYIKLMSRVVTSRWSTKLRCLTYSKVTATGVNVTGRIRQGSGPKTFWRRVFHPDLYTGATLAAQLSLRGIRVAGELRRRRLPADTPLLVEHRSERLGDIIYRMNKVSQNMVSEQLTLALGAAVFGPPATFHKGRVAVDLFLRDLGIQRGSYLLENGSGLSRRSRIRAKDMVRVLDSIQQDLALEPETIASLPLAGRDGTLKERFIGSEATGLIRAKTGTLSGIVCLSGVASFGGRSLIFSFFTARVARRHQVRSLHEQMAEALVAYLRSVSSGAPARGAPPGG